MQAAGRPFSPSFYVNFNRNFCLYRLFRHARLWIRDILIRSFGGSECCGVSITGAHKSALLSSIWMMYQNADSFVSAHWLSAVRRRLNLYRLISTVTTFVYVASDCITITDHFSQVKRGFVSHVKRQDINEIPEELPTKAPNGVTVPYVKRQDINVIPEELPTKAPNGVTVPYVKRQDINVIPEELPTKAPNGVTVPYVKRQDVNEIPEELPTKAPNGVTVPY